MSNAYFVPPAPFNEPVLDYAPGSTERKILKAEIDRMRSEAEDIPMYINGKEVFTDNKVEIHPPHDLSHKLGTYNKGDKEHVKQAIDACLSAKEAWENMPWQERASIFLKAADLLTGPYRDKMNAATMLGQSKTVFQSEIDAVAELADFWRFNVEYMTEIYGEQPNSSENVWNRTEHRALEGFVFAVTPFNFTSIGGNLPTAPALMGNCVVWKPAKTQVYSARIIMEILMEAGLPAGVINMVITDGKDTSDVVFDHKDLAGLHFTGSTNTFELLWKTVANNLEKYKTYPRIVGETGGKDYILMHPSADPSQVSTAITRGAFEFQGQKCSAVSRCYIPESHWPEVKEQLIDDVSSFDVGGPEDFKNFFTAVIDESAFDKISGYIDEVKASDDAEIIYGGGYSKERGYFIDPTIVLAKEPKTLTMREEIFGPVVTIYVYKDEEFEETMDLLDNTSPYALTGAIFSRDRQAVDKATKRLRHTAGNFYINDKPTGAVVGQQPFGGARKSGTNDKAGSVLNLHRWVSQRSIKENFLSPTDYRYPFMDEE
jgi:1-pyrroline-5-carboxylate dehydrogenase